ncbi:MAG: hypothetical protein CSA15_01270 [Candidatus Delongbacteria bacterium]|nr:MAG: hypothetical protein CSA15_01270 [Candidatus Delongbacteria bacterium]
MKFEALILAAGFGKRLGDLTKDTPKPLVEIMGKPLIYFVIQKLKKYGVSKIFINTHYLHEKMESYFKKNSFGVEIELIYEKEILDSGGAIANIQDKLSTNYLLVHNADIISDLDINESLKYHIEQRNTVTLIIQKRETSRKLQFDNRFYFKGRFDSSKGYKGYGFQGIHILNKEIVESMEKGKFPIIDYYCKLKDKGYKIGGFEMCKNSLWKDLGRVEDLMEIEKDIRFNKILGKK